MYNDTATVRPRSHIYTHSAGVSGQITQCLRYLGDAIKEIVLRI